MANEGYVYEVETEETSFLGRKKLNSRVCTEARVVTCIYRNNDTGYSIYNVENTENRWLKISGYFPAELRYNSFYSFDGIVKEGKFGRILQVEEYKSALPQSEDGILTVLRTLPRLDTLAYQLYQQLGDEVLELILNDPEQVARRVKGVGIKLAMEWQSRLQELKESDVIMQTLRDYKIPLAAAKGLLEKYPDIIERLKRSPYFLAEEVRGFSFVNCDKIALDNGYPLNGHERLQQAMLYTLKRASAAKGDCYMSEGEFWDQVKKLVNIRIDYRTARSILAGKAVPAIQAGNKQYPIDCEKLEAALQKWQKGASRPTFSYVCAGVPEEDLQTAFFSLKSISYIVQEEDRIFLGYMRDAENEVALRLRNMVGGELGEFTEVESILDSVCQREGYVLEKKQREAVLRFCRAKGGVFVLNGRAGCGKTFTLNIIIKVMTELYRRQGGCFSAKIMAPTGKAAQVAHKSTGLPASTVHKALHLVADSNEESTVTITGDCVVVDEFSMMGLTLAASLLKAITPGTKLIIMGDYEQLPSIDPGNVLRDIIESGIVPVVTLNVVRRQAEGSGILYNANRILDGDMIQSKIVKEKTLENNAYLYRSETPPACRDKIVEMVTKLRKRGFTQDDIQVLCPQKLTEVGIDSLNYFLQQAMNPSKGKPECFSKEIEIRDTNGTLQKQRLMLREGDKVINTANDYEKKFYNYSKGVGFTEDFCRTGIVNGEVGRIAVITDVKDGMTTHRRIYVRYGPNQYALYEDDWNDLSLAYAMTIHRAQGSQWPIVIAPIMGCNRKMLNRKLFYTLYTRAQKTSIIYGEAEAIQYAVENDASSQRLTRLKERLRGGV